MSNHAPATSGVASATAAAPRNSAPPPSVDATAAALSKLRTGTDDGTGDTDSEASSSVGVRATSSGGGASPGATPLREPDHVACTFAENEPGAVKLGSFNHAEWGETPVNVHPFTIRGKTYLTDHIKYRFAEAPRFAVVATDLYHMRGKAVPHMAEHPDSPIHKLRESLPAGTQFFVVQFMFPEAYYSLTLYAASRPGSLDGDTPFARLYRRFREGPDTVRNACFKLIPRVVQGPMVVSKMVGETPAIIGRKLTTTYHVGADYVEVDCDLGSSVIARRIVNRVSSFASSLVVDLGVLLEGHSEEELPEVMLCSLRMIRGRMKLAPVFGGGTISEAEAAEAAAATAGGGDQGAGALDSAAAAASSVASGVANMLGGWWGGGSAAAGSGSPARTSTPNRTSTPPTKPKG